MTKSVVLPTEYWKQSVFVHTGLTSQRRTHRMMYVYNGARVLYGHSHQNRVVQRLFSWQLGAQLQTKYLGEEILIHPQAICRQNSLQAHLSMNDVTYPSFHRGCTLSICL